MANCASSSLGNFKNFSYFLKVSIFNFKISFSIQFVRNAGLAGDGQIALSPYPNVLSWIERVKKLPGFVGMIGIKELVTA